MPVVRGVFALLFSLVALGVAASAQSSSDEVIFTISVAPPTASKDIQVRYFVTDQAGARWTSTLAQTSQDKVLIRVNTADRAAKSFKAVAYAPGCQFVTFSADDLSSSSSRQGDFQCLKLPTTQLRGSVPASPGQQNVQVEAMYVVGWASKFFSVPGASISPMMLAKAPVEADGSFSMDLPDFTADPLWGSLTRKASLVFFLSDVTDGHRIAELTPPASLSRGGILKVSANYPDVAFAIRQTAIAKTSKP